MPSWIGQLQRSRVAVSLIIAGAFVSLGVLAGAGWLLDERREADLAAARHEAETLAGSLAEQTNLTFTGADVVLRIMLDDIRKKNVASAAELNALMGLQESRQTLRNAIAGLGQIDAANIIDTQGTVISSSRSVPVDQINVSDRDFFISVRDDPTLPYFISAPVTNRATGEKTVFLSRRITAPDGAFLGIVVSTIRIEYFRALYRTLSSTDGDFVGLQRRDGERLARYPELDKRPGPAPPGDPTRSVRPDGVRIASFVGVSPVTGKVVIRAAAALADFPLVVVVGRTEAAVLANWARQAKEIWAVSGLIVLVFVAAIAFLARQIAAREFSEAVVWGTLDNISKGVALIDAQGRMRIHNRRLLQMLDLPASFLADQPFMQDVIRVLWDRGEFGLNGAQLDDAIRPLIRAGRLVNQKITYERRRPDGTVLEIAVNPLPAGGEVWTYADVTIARNREAALQAALQGRVDAEAALQKRRDDLIQELAERVDPETPSAPGARTEAEAACDWIWETDDTLRINFLSKRFAETSGLRWEDAYGHCFTDLVTCGCDPGAMTELSAVFASREAFLDLTHRVVCSENDRRFWRLSGKPVFDPETGAFVGYRGTGTDVTARLEYEAEMNAALIRARDAEQEARQANRRLVDAIESIPEGIMLFDADDRLVMCNAAVNRIYPLTADLMLPGARYADLLRASAARDQVNVPEHAIDEWIAAHAALRAAPSGGRIEQRLANGRWIQIEERKMRDGGTVGLRVDVTEARQMEAKERAQEYMAAEMRAARAIQIGMLPSERFQRDVAVASGLDIAGRSACCSELGGDLWGLVTLDNGGVGF